MVQPAIAGAQSKSRGLLSLFADEVKPAAAHRPNWKDAGLISSPFAKLETVPVRAVVVQEGFWSKRRKMNLESSIPSMREELVTHGRMDNLRRCGYFFGVLRVSPRRLW
jgi:hypothetical protein